jgi:hypothetical protein
LRLGEAEDALAVQQFDEVELDFIAVNHNLIIRENREIATSDGRSSFQLNVFRPLHSRSTRLLQTATFSRVSSRGELWMNC